MVCEIGRGSSHEQEGMILTTGKHRTYDIGVIGGGPGGYVAAIYAAQKGKKVALVEKESLGGTCVNKGCIPTKALLATAKLRHHLLKSDVFSFDQKGPEINVERLVGKKNAAVDLLSKGVESLIRKNGIDYYKGKAKFSDQKNIEIRDSQDHLQERIAADAFIIATGSTPGHLPEVVPDGKGIITSDQAINPSSIPKELIIIGGGVIGIEFCSVFKNLGSKVTILEILPNILPTEDREIATTLRRILEKNGTKIVTEIRVKMVRNNGNKVIVETVGKTGGETSYEADKVLLAVGRAPYTEGLGLERLGIELNKGFIRVNKRMETGVPGIYAIGDVIGGIMLAHAASEEGIVAVENITGGHLEVDYRKVPRCVYSIPEVGSIGLSEEEAVANNVSFEVGRFPFLANGKAVVEGESDGFIKILADKQIGEILGVHILGENATDLIGGGVVAMSLEATIEDIGASVHAHPTLFEAFKEAVLDVKGKAIHVPPKSPRESVPAASRK